MCREGGSPQSRQRAIQDARTASVAAHPANQASVTAYIAKEASVAIYLAREASLTTFGSESRVMNHESSHL